MAYTSPYLLTKSFEVLLSSVLDPIDIYAVDADIRKIVTTLRRELTDARLDVRDYELSETRTEQLDKAKAAKERLEQVRKHMLAASEHNIFGAADVAQFAAQLDEIIEYLQ